MPNYMVNVDTGFRVREGAAAIPNGTEFESEETDVILDGVKRRLLVVIKRKTKDAAPILTLDELLIEPEPVAEVEGVTITGPIETAPDAEAPKTRKARRKKK